MFITQCFNSIFFIQENCLWSLVPSLCLRSHLFPLKAVYGVMRTIEGLQAFDDVMKHTRMRKWYQAMEKVIREHGGQE